MGRQSDAKERLLAAAIELIWRHSYGAVSVDMICESAGVKKGSFYYFFKSKNDLVAAALKHGWDVVRPEYDRMFSPSAPPLARIAEYCRFICDIQRKQRDKCGCVLGCPFSSIAAEVAHQDPELSETVQRLVGHKICYLESAIRDAVADGTIRTTDSAGLARSLYLFIEGSMQQARISNRIESLDTLPDDAMRLLGVERVGTPETKS